ncbi:MAG: hypothetical protein O7H41_01615 [Planctomycetota bacterium]|nr:hypothetical protein [Planctomycetota bacterium]
MKPQKNWAKTTALLLVALLLILSGITCSKKSSSKKKTKPYVIVFVTLPPDGTVVNETFAVEIQITDRSTGAPVAPGSPLDVTLAVANGSGALFGTLVLPVSTTNEVFGGLAYDDIGALQIEATSARSDPVVTNPIEFVVNVGPNPADLGTIGPGDPIPPVDFTLTEFNSIPFAVGGALQWTLTDLSSLLVVQSGNTPFGGTSMVQVSLTPITVEAGYELKGIVEGSTSEATVPLTISSFILQNEPGPFVALKTGCVGLDYSDGVAYAVPGATAWGILSGTLPAGLALDGATGDITGNPTAPANSEFTLWAMTAPFFATPIRCALAVFSVAETEILAGQDFKGLGPLAVMTYSDNVIGFTSTFDNMVYNTAITIYSPDPETITTPLPMFILHHGRGFHFNEYDDMLSHIASYNFICVSVQDCVSFQAPLCPPPSAFYDGSGADAGMQSGGAFMKGVMDHMVQRSKTVADLFEGKIDEERVFMSGHSRGGGATHGAHVQGLNYQIAGVVYFMAYDLRCFTRVIPPATPPRFDVPAAMPRLPSLIIAAEMDSDLVYPISDHFIERATGPMTSVTLYGGNHARISDAPHPDDVFFPCYPGPPYITRVEEQTRVANQVIAFLKRWGNLDLSLEGFLYGNESAGSDEIGVTSLRGVSQSVLVDDFQDATSATNALGGSNSLTGGTRSEAKVYPPDCWGACGAITTVGIKNSIISFNAASANYTTTIPPNTVLSNRRRFIFRIMQTSLTGFDWATLEVMLEDGSGQTSSVTLFDRLAPTTTYLPDYMGGGNQVYDRFVEVQVDLSNFTGVDLDDLVSVQFLFDFAGTPGAGQQIALDDIRFE